MEPKREKEMFAVIILNVLVYCTVSQYPQQTRTSHMLFIKETVTLLQEKQNKKKHPFTSCIRLLNHL